MSLRRMLPFILINILVSATVVLAILWWWDGRKPENANTQAVAEEIALPAQDLAPSTPVGEVEESQTSTDPAAGSDDTPETHVVQAGDTLGLISVQYSVPIDDIMAANNIDDPNFLAVGQELIIPLDGLPVATPVPAGDEEGPAEDASAEDAAVDNAPLPTPLPTEPAGEGEAVIEIAGVSGVGSAQTETVEIVNSGSNAARLQGWELRSARGLAYTFGQITLFGDGAGIVVHTSAGTNNATDLYWGETSPLWQSGDTVTLVDANGVVQAEFQIP